MSPCCRKQARGPPGSSGCRGTVALPYLEDSLPKVRNRAGAEALQSPVAQVRNIALGRTREELGATGSLSYPYPRGVAGELAGEPHRADFLLGQRKWDLEIGTRLPAEGVSGEMGQRVVCGGETGVGTWSGGCGCQGLDRISGWQQGGGGYQEVGLSRGQTWWGGAG